jgi:prepilin-type N-terminal cleavage/methylation domain-containing protein
MSARPRGHGARAGGPESGFTLIELMIAIIVLVVGILGLASSMASMTRYQDLSAAHADMTALADNRIEMLRVAATYRTADTMQLAVGGNLVTPTAPYTATVVERGRTYILTWVVTAGPAGTRNVTVRVRPTVDDARTPSRLDFPTLIQLVTAAP